MSRADLCFLICTETGFLEKESLLLCKSLRRFGGRFSNVSIFSFSPRKGRCPSKETRKQLEALQVEHLNLRLNKEYESYPYANKVMVADYAQSHLPFETLVFLDSDLINLAEPKLLELGRGFDVAVGPVHVTSTAANGRFGQNERFWQAMYKRFGVTSERFVLSVLEQERIRAYWNAGVIASRRSSALFAVWREVFESVMRQKLRPETGGHFLDEIALSLAILKHIPWNRIRQLPTTYNFPLYAYKRMSAQRRWRSPESTVFYHYMNAFEMFPFGSLEFLQKRDSKKTEWMKENLSVFGLEIQ